MNARNDVGGDARTTRRFVPREALSIAVAGGTIVPIHGNVLDISPVGARIATDRVLENGRAITLDVRCGYDFLFQAGARIVWQTRSPLSRESDSEPFKCLQGMRFTELSPFSRSLILRLSDKEPGEEPRGAAWMRRLDDAESDPDLTILFREGSNGVAVPSTTIARPRPGPLPHRVNGNERARGTANGSGSAREITLDTETPPPPPSTLDPERTLAPPARGLVEASDERFDLLSDPELERLLEAEWELESDLSAEQALVGNLDQFDVTVVLQMLEATRSTGVLYLEAASPGRGDEKRFGELHFDDGRVCGCFSRDGEDDEAPFKWVVANRGRFRFVPSKIRANLRGGRSTTALLLEWQLQNDLS